jgi:hypothetical protein
MRPDRVGLKYHTDSPFFRGNEILGGTYNPVAYTNLSGSRFFKTGDHSQHRCLSAARRPKEAYEFLIVYDGGEFSDDFHAVKVFCHTINANNRHTFSSV